MGFIALCGTVFVILQVPETMGKSLEEMDELYAVSLLSCDNIGRRDHSTIFICVQGRVLTFVQMKLWPWQWRSAVTTGVGSAVARAEHHSAEPGLEKKVDAEHVSPSPLFVGFVYCITVEVLAL